MLDVACTTPRIKIYTRVMDVCKSPLFSRLRREEVRERVRKPWTRWTDLADDSENKPQYVLEVLLAEKAFDLAREWSQVHNVPQNITQVGEGGGGGRERGRAEGE